MTIKTIHTIVRVAAAEYIRKYRDAAQFIEYCKVCDNYGTVWTCPPFDFNPLDRIESFRYTHLIGTQLFLEDGIRHMPRNLEERKEISSRILTVVRKYLDNQVIQIEQSYPGTLVFFAGSCYACPRESCTRCSGEACIHPHQARSSLESYGFDIARTASELLKIELMWGHDNLLPQYFTLVCGLFSNHEIKDLNLERTLFEVPSI